MAAATSPADDVRSTVGPSRAITAPAPASSCASAGLTPPSGPTTSMMSPAAGKSSALSATGPAGSSSTAMLAVATRRASSAVVTAPVTSGSQARRDCLAAWAAAARHRASARSPRSPAQRVTQRCAAQGTITSTPPSVIRSTASGPCSPLGSAWATTSTGSGRGSLRRASTLSSSVPALAAVTTHSATSPAPSVRSARSPTPSRRTVAACRPSGPSSTTTSAASAAGSLRKTGGRESGPAGRSAAVEGIPQPGEEALLPRHEPARRGLLGPELRQLLDQGLLLVVELGRRLDGHMDDQVTPARAVQVAHAQAVHRDDLARLGAGADVQLPGPVQRLHAQRGAEGGRGHRDGHRAVQVVGLALADRVRPLDDLQEQVTRRAAARPDLPFAGQLDVGPVLHPGGNTDLDGAPGPDPAVAVAFGAGPPDDGAEPAARRARPRRHHLTEERPRDVADLAAAAAHVARLRVGARRRALTGTGGADHRGVHDQVPGRAERAFGQVELHPDGRVPAPPGPAARAVLRRAGAEEGVHDVAERESGSTEAARARGARPGERVGAEVVHLALLGIREHLVGLGDLLEPLLRAFVGVDVGVQFPGEPPVRLLDVVRARVPRHAQGGVVVVGHYDPARIWLT